VCVNTPTRMQHKRSSHTYFWQFIGYEMNFVLTMFFGSSGLIHIFVTMKQHNKSLVLTTQYTHAKRTVLRQFTITKYHGTWLPQSLASFIESMHLSAYFWFQIDAVSGPVKIYILKFFLLEVSQNSVRSFLRSGLNTQKIKK
jgi:hypothetical protein